MQGRRLDKAFFEADSLEVAQNLLGKIIVRQFDNYSIKRYRISETEAYRGEDDLACHAAKGRTSRTEVMYHAGGKVYVYLVYGVYWMLNFVTSETNYPAAVLIRSAGEITGPGRLGRELQLDKTFYGEDLSTSKRIWVEDDGLKAPVYKAIPRIGVDYAGEWAQKKWRFVME
ncbi:MAG: DNA-3-methyladenine glycosylase [Prolixibacteraceae bacterium]|nr:DNA-3-methyladenine glycosylase [Prolixibacteraceae bacterium]MBN2648810.1 DNA-3-methyladenine glycosylase [Prolixibacteraceae bacterium]